MKRVRLKETVWCVDGRRLWEGVEFDAKEVETTDGPRYQLSRDGAVYWPWVKPELCEVLRNKP